MALMKKTMTVRLTAKIREKCPDSSMCFKAFLVPCMLSACIDSYRSLSLLYVGRYSELKISLASSCCPFFMREKMRSLNGPNSGEIFSTSPNICISLGSGASSSSKIFLYIERFFSTFFKSSFIYFS